MKSHAEDTGRTTRNLHAVPSPEMKRRRRTTASLQAIDARRTTATMPAVSDPEHPDPTLAARRRITATLPAMAPTAAQPSPAVRLRNVTVLPSAAARRVDRDTQDLEELRSTLELMFEQEARDPNRMQAYIQVLVDLGQRGQAGVELLWLAGFHADERRLDEALAAMDHAQRLEPRCMVSQRLAPLLCRLGSHGAAPCERAIEQHMAASRLETARELLELLVRTFPEHAEYRHRLAKVELLLGQTSTALVHLRAAIERYRDEDRVAMLVSAAEEWLRHGGGDTELLWELSRLYLQADLPGRALNKLKQLQRLVPDDLEIIERIAYLQARLGRVEATLGTLWRLVREMRNAGTSDEQVRILLKRAREWNDATAHHTSVDALARKVLTLRRSGTYRTVYAETEPECATPPRTPVERHDPQDGPHELAAEHSPRLAIVMG